MAANGRYVKVATRFWTDEKIINMDPETKVLYLYCLSSPHSNMAGFYRLPKAYIQADLGLTKEQLDKGFNKLLDRGLIKYCERTSIILITNYFKYNTIQNKNQAKGAASRTSELPKNSLVEDYIKAVKAYAGNYKEVLMKGLPKEFIQGFGNTDSDTESDTDTESESESESDKEELNFENFFEKNVDKFEPFLQTMTKGVVLHACKISIKKDKPMAYCQTVLKDWRNKGIEKVEDLKKASKNKDNPACDYKWKDFFIDFDKFKR